jgi:hypothetical protein
MVTDLNRGAAWRIELVDWLQSRPVEIVRVGIEGNRWGVAGADAHKRSITIAVLDSTGGVVDEATFAITADGVIVDDPTCAPG